MLERLVTILWGEPKRPAYKRRRAERLNRRQKRDRIDSTLQKWSKAPAAKQQGSIPDHLPFERVPQLLSKGERAFWHSLYHAVKGKYRLFCKVRLADVVHARGTVWEERRWFKRIRGYHVDFVICDPESTMPLLVVELDDKSHRSMKSHGDRDNFKDAILAAAGVPIYRIKAQQAYDPVQIENEIRRLIIAGRASK